MAIPISGPPAQQRAEIDQAFVATSYAVATLIALVVGSYLAALIPASFKWTIPAAAIHHDQGNLYVAVIPLPRFTTSRGDGSGPGIRSAGQLAEDGKVIGPAHVPHATIRAAGNGQFSHWLDAVYFSTSDNSDPRVNGRTYTFRHQLAPSRDLLTILWLTLAAASAVWLAFLALNRHRIELVLEVSRALRSRIVQHDGAPLLLILFVMVAATHPQRWLLSTDGAAGDYWRVGVIAVLCVLALRLDFAKTSRSYAIAVRAIGLTLTAFYILRQPPNEFIRSETMPLMTAAPFVAVACAVIGWRRPAFFLPVIFLISWQAQEVGRAIGQRFAHGEELTLQESLLILIGCGLTFHAVIGSTTANRSRLFSAIVLAACAIHFSNYFYSAHAKIALDGGPLDWLKTNTAQALLPVSDGLGTLPFGQFPELAQSLYRLWDQNGVLMNAGILVLQLLALPAALSVGLIRVFLLLFDGMHLAIAGLSGIFFYLWISLNVSFAAALWAIKERLALASRALWVFFVLAAPAAVTIFMAGWYDTRAFNRVSISAITRDGAEHVLSPRAFYLLSYVFYSDALMSPDFRDRYAFPTIFYGTAYTSKTRAVAQACQLPDNQPEALELASFVGPATERMHRALIEAPPRGLFDFRPYPHHFIERGGRFADMSTIDRSAITAYRYRWQAVCVASTATGFEEQILRTAETTIPVSSPK